MILVILLTLVFLSCDILQAQPNLLWGRTYSLSNYSDGAVDVHQTNDGGFVMVGSSTLANGGESWLIKTNGNGDTVWTRILGDPDSGVHPVSMCKTNDGGFVIVGSARSPSPIGAEDVWLEKTDSIGNTQWRKYYDNTDPRHSFDYGFSVQQVADSGYIIAAIEFDWTGLEEGQYDFWLIKTDPDGDTVWTSTFGGEASDIAYSVHQTIDGGYVIAGETYSFGPGSPDFWIIRTDASGDSVWSRVIDGARGANEKEVTVRPTYDGGYILAGSSSPGGLLIRLDASGSTIWIRSYGEVNESSSIYDIEEVADSGFVFCGSTIYGLDWNFWLVRTNVDGEIVWDFTTGTDYDDWGRALDVTEDSGYVVAGNFCGSYCDTYLMRLVEGPLNVPVTDGVPASYSLSQNYPNPFNPITTLLFSLRSSLFANLTVYNLLGREVATLVNEKLGPGTYTLRWDASGVSSGVYYYRLQTEEFVATKKLVLLR